MFNTLLADLDITLSKMQIDQFIMYYEMLIERNKVINLTTITEYEEVVKKHFIDSLSLVKVFNINQELFVLDMGTGAGFPGIPLKIAFPNLKMVLFDSVNKKINFLEDVIDALGLENVTAVHGRAEDYGKKVEYREKFDLCVSRAVARLSMLAEFCIPFVKLEGYFISYKAGNIQEEVEESNDAIRILGGKIDKAETFQLPGSDISRSFVVVKKIEVTPTKFPRKAGKLAKNPIVI